MVTLWGRQWTRDELFARVGRLEQVAGIRLVEGGDGAERLGGRPLAWASPAGVVGSWYCEPAGIGWFRGFPGGLVSTCGLDHTRARRPRPQ